jgi:hypothetical protein
MGGTEDVTDNEPSRSPENSAQYDGLMREFEDDDEDSDWEDIDSDEEDDSSEGSYACFQVEEDSSFIVFSDD